LVFDFYTVTLGLTVPLQFTAGTYAVTITMTAAYTGN
jgi:hypothetical protein